LGIQFANRFKTTITGAHTAATTTINLSSSTGFPALAAGDYCYLTLVSPDQQTIEVVKVTARAANALTVVRGQEGTAATTWATGTAIELRLTAQALLDALAELLPLKGGSLSGKLSAAAPALTGAGLNVGYGVTPTSNQANGDLWTTSGGLYFRANNAQFQVVTSGTLNNYQPLIAAGTTSQFWRGDKTWVSLSSADVGLPSVENKSSATIRAELTGVNVTNALGYTPAVSGHTHSWSDIVSGKPTTLAGYGITDAALATHNHDTAYVRVNASTNLGNGVYIRFAHASQTDGNDGLIGAGVWASGLNIIGVQTAAGLGRQTRVWGELMDEAGILYAKSSAVLPLTGGTVTGSINIRNGAPTLFWQDTDSRSFGIHTNSNQAYLMRGAVDSITWESLANGNHPMIIDLNTGFVTFGMGATFNGNLAINTGGEGAISFGAAGGAYLYGNGTNMGFYKPSGGSMTWNHSNGDLTTSGHINGKDLRADRGDGSGVIYLGGTGAYLYYDSANYWLNGNGALHLGGKRVFKHSDSTRVSSDITISTAAPSGGYSGDVWFKV
jgi:hypothetical protein